MVISAEKDTKLRRFRRMVEEATSKTEWQITATGKRVRRVYTGSLLDYDQRHTVAKVARRVAIDNGVWPCCPAAVAFSGCDFAELLEAAFRDFERNYAIVYKRGQIISVPSDVSELLLLEDITTTGASAYRAAQACLDHGLTPVACLTLIDRGLGADRLLASIGCRLVPILTVE